MNSSWISYALPKSIAVAAAVALTIAFASAQRMDVPVGVLAGGSEIAIGFDDPLSGGKTVKLVINNDDSENYEEQVFYIKLTTSGQAVLKWQVPAHWEQALFQADGFQEEFRVVAPGSALASATGNIFLPSPENQVGRLGEYRFLRTA